MFLFFFNTLQCQFLIFMYNNLIWNIWCINHFWIVNLHHPPTKRKQHSHLEAVRIKSIAPALATAQVNPKKSSLIEQQNTNFPNGSRKLKRFEQVRLWEKWKERNSPTLHWRVKPSFFFLISFFDKWRVKTRIKSIFLSSSKLMPKF